MSVSRFFQILTAPGLPPMQSISFDSACCHGGAEPISLRRSINTPNGRRLRQTIALSDGKDPGFVEVLNFEAMHRFWTASRRKGGEQSARTGPGTSSRDRSSPLRACEVTVIKSCAPSKRGSICIGAVGYPAGYVSRSHWPLKSDRMFCQEELAIDSDRIVSCCVCKPPSLAGVPVAVRDAKQIRRSYRLLLLERQVARPRKSPFA